LWQRSVETALELWDAAMPSADPQDLAERFVDEQELLTCLRELPEPFRTVLLLCDLEELDEIDVAKLLHVPLGTVKSRHARGRAKLRAALLARRQSEPTFDAKGGR
jgi:RNA polymerase sigma-70 factor (ECF subfamily)